MNIEQEREAFEEHFSKPPFEWEFHRYGEDSAWPGNYQLYEHQCAWEAWQARATLQSPEVQAWKRDADRLDWLESCEDSHGFCHAGYGDYIYYAHQVTGMPSVREVIDDAMLKER